MVERHAGARVGATECLPIGRHLLTTEQSPIESRRCVLRLGHAQLPVAPKSGDRRTKAGERRITSAVGDRRYRTVSPYASKLGQLVADFLDEDRRRRGRISSGGRNPAKYCTSNARNAASTVEPIPTTPSSTLGPRSATQSPLRMYNRGRRTAAGLPGWTSQ